MPDLHSHTLKDAFGRVHDYLRISLTDVCNLRCFYCMPDENVRFMPPAHLMQADEIERLAAFFVENGIKKIRLTGGEPLVRKDFSDVVNRLGKLPVELTLTTNGLLLHEYAALLVDNGVRSLNISLDTLKPERFKLMTGRDQFARVWNNIRELEALPLHIKINMVVIDGYNEDELNDFVALTETMNLHVRFIEFMPFSHNNWKSAKVFPMTAMLNRIGQQFEFTPLENNPHDTARKFKVPGFQGTFAVISTMSEPFCSGCNRLRLTADGKMKNCLFSKGEADLLHILRSGGDLASFIDENLKAKAWQRGGQIPEWYENTDAEVLVNRTMISIGG